MEYIVDQNADMKRLARDLRENDTLKSLVVRGYLDDDAVTKIADALKENDTLLHLTLRYQELAGSAPPGGLEILYFKRYGGSSVFALAQALRVNRTLETLNLNPGGLPKSLSSLRGSGTFYSTQKEAVYVNMSPILDVIKEFGRLKKLTLNVNYLAPEHRREFEKLAQERPNFKLILESK